ncbi:hypothetical protein [Streptomyces sp. NPDC004376]
MTGGAEFSVAQWKAVAAAAGAEVQVVTDAFGRPDVQFDRPAMERLRDFAREIGATDMAEFFTNCLNAGGLR